VVVNGLATVDDFAANVFHELGEASELVLDLVSKFASVAHDEGGAGLGLVRDVLKDGQDEDGGLSHAGNGLAEGVHAEDSVGDAALLDIGGMLETAISDSLLELGLEEHILETGGLHAGVGGGLSGGAVSVSNVVVFKDVVLVVGEGVGGGLLVYHVLSLLENGLSLIVPDLIRLQRVRAHLWLYRPASESNAHKPLPQHALATASHSLRP
jgi:hypothetical protein